MKAISSVLSATSIALAFCPACSAFLAPTRAMVIPVVRRSSVKQADQDWPFSLLQAGESDQETRWFFSGSRL
jgi:hypothetical protein